MVTRTPGFLSQLCPRLAVTLGTWLALSLSQCPCLYDEASFLVFTDSEAIAFISYSTLDSVFTKRFLNTENQMADRKLMNVCLNSKVVSGAVKNRTLKFFEHVDFTLQHRRVRVAALTLLCAQVSRGLLKGCFSCRAFEFCCLTGLPVDLRNRRRFFSADTGAVLVEDIIEGQSRPGWVIIHHIKWSGVTILPSLPHKAGIIGRQPPIDSRVQGNSTRWCFL